VLVIHVEIDSKQTEKVEFRNFLWFSYKKKVIRGCFGKRRSMRQPGYRWKHPV